MNELQWPYCNHDREVFLSKLILAEHYLQKYGAKFVGKANELDTWISQGVFNVSEHIEKNIWKFQESFVRVGRVYFSEKPFIVLEFSQKKEGPYEDADPFPYDLLEAEFEQEIKLSLGILEV